MRRLKTKAACLTMALALMVGACAGVLFALDGIGEKAFAEEYIDVHLLTRDGDVLYSTDVVEIDRSVADGWTDRGVAWKAPSAGEVAVYREVNNNVYACNHNWTTSKEEHDYLVSAGWVDEGIAWYSAEDEGLPVCRVYNPNSGLHFYTAGQSTRDAMVAQGWGDEGEAGWCVSEIGPAASYAMALWEGAPFAIDAIPSQSYTGDEIKPSLTVKLDLYRQMADKTVSIVMTEGEDYTVSYSDNVEPGTASVTVTGLGDYDSMRPTTKTFEILAARSDGEDGIQQAMHRLYNPNSGEHFYTADDGERDGLVAAGWNSEGEGWTAPESSNTPVYRMYNPVAGEHHYTPNAEERDGLLAAGWNDEGVGWYSDDARTTPLFRDYNPNAFSNNHNYTTSAEEHAALAAAGWVDEGIGWYGA